MQRQGMFIQGAPTEYESSLGLSEVHSPLGEWSVLYSETAGSLPTSKLRPEM